MELEQLFSKRISAQGWSLKPANNNTINFLSLIILKDRVEIKKKTEFQANNKDFPLSNN